jgi:hypothetical protein
VSVLKMLGFGRSRHRREGAERKPLQADLKNQDCGIGIIKNISNWRYGFSIFTPKKRSRPESGLCKSRILQNIRRHRL